MLTVTPAVHVALTFCETASSTPSVCAVGAGARLVSASSAVALGVRGCESTLPAGGVGGGDADRGREGASEFVMRTVRATDDARVTTGGELEPSDGAASGLTLSENAAGGLTSCESVPRGLVSSEGAPGGVAPSESDAVGVPVLVGERVGDPVPLDEPVGEVVPVAEQVAHSEPGGAPDAEGEEPAVSEPVGERESERDGVVDGDGVVDAVGVGVSVGTGVVLGVGVGYAVTDGDAGAEPVSDADVPTEREPEGGAVVDELAVAVALGVGLVVIDADPVLLAVGVTVEVALGDVVGDAGGAPVAEGDEPAVSEPVGVRESERDRVFVVVGVGTGDGVLLPVPLADIDGVAHSLAVVELVPLSLAVTEDDAPRVSELVGVRVREREAGGDRVGVRVGVAVGVAVALPVCVLLGVCAADAVDEGDSELVTEAVAGAEGVPLAVPPRDSVGEGVDVVVDDMLRVDDPVSVPEGVCDSVSAAVLDAETVVDGVGVGVAPELAVVEPVPLSDGVSLALAP